MRRRLGRGGLGRARFGRDWFGRDRFGRDGDAGAAVVDFVLISVLLLALLLAVVQVAVYFYVRNVAAASAADAARYAAAAGVRPAAGTTRARLLLNQGLDHNDADALHCSTRTGRDRRSGLATVTVACSGHLRLFFSPFRSPLPIGSQSTVLRERVP